jgi:3-oxoacyl-[acyl-carrier protein] reductase
MEWREQVAVVTGGARGIGRATARLLAQRGAAVCVNYAVHSDAAEAVAAEIVTAGGRAVAVAADVAEPAAVEAMVVRTETELGPVTILVNNAGGLGRARSTPTTASRSRACARSTWTA